MKFNLLFFILFVSAGMNNVFTQSLAFAENFTDHAVLQRNVNHPIWGWAKPKTKVTLTFNDADFKAKTDERGRWEVTLPPQTAGGPYALSIRTKRETEQITDLYFGDVYLLSGQSNMEWRLEQSDESGTRARAIADPLIREMKVKKSFAARPKNHLDIASPWQAGTAESIQKFSAVGSYFAHYVRQSVDVPIGLLHASWGGSRIEAWMRAELLGVPVGSTLRDPEEDTDADAPALVNYRANFDNAAPPTEDRGEALGYLNPATDYAAWPVIKVPGLWEDNGYRDVDGHFYLARYVNLTPEQAAGKATLHLGPIDDSDWTYINGQLVGEMYDAYSMTRNYELPSGTLKAGKNTILIRIEDTGGGGGLTAGDEVVKLTTVTGAIALAGDWHYQIGSFVLRKSPEQNMNQVPTILYNKMIHPLANLPLTGILWYQGESNASGQSALDYAQQFQDMITDWRQHFGRKELPFYWVQLANFLAPQAEPNETGWAVLRNSQTKALQLPHTGQAVITDIGEADDIHPRNKWEVGRRLSLHALKHIYDQPEITADSPTIKAAKRRGDFTELNFDHVPTKLLAKGDRYGYVRGFVYQNTRGQWKWARALIDAKGKTITVMPVAGERAEKIRYGWANNPDGNVFSQEGLPLTPFEIAVSE